MFFRTLKRFSNTAIVGFLLWFGAGALLAQNSNSSAKNSIPYVGASWSTFNGDTSGRRYSALTQINSENVHALKLAWAFQTHSVTLKSTPLEIDGILYFTVPDQVWAIDAKTGEKIWEFRRDSEGDHLGQRGVAFYNNRIYFGTPDAHLFCLDTRNGKKIWDVTVADVKFGYYLSVAPLVIKGRIIIGTSGDSSDVPHFIEAFDWKTGKTVWRTSTLPKPGTPAARTWPNDQAMNHGGGAAWITGTYDPDLNLIYWGTGNPHPVGDGLGRVGDNLYTCSILALNPDTGALAWYFQASPHDTHDWDAVQTPVLFNAEFKGKPRELLAQASRNGYFFVLDRKTGKNLLTAPYVKTNWAKGIDADGSPIPNPAKEPQPDGALVKGAAQGGTVWASPSFDPETGLFYINAMEGYAYWYLALDKNKLPKDHQGGGDLQLLTTSVLLGMDYKTGKIRWRRESGNRPLNAGILTTAGHLLFTADASGNLLALDPSDGRVLWHTRPGGDVDDAAPMTYQVDGTQYVLTGVDGVMYAWSLAGSL
jgi:alcohol dehydrogenase (cytochrome c)